MALSRLKLVDQTTNLPQPGRSTAIANSCVAVMRLTPFFAGLQSDIPNS